MKPTKKKRPRLIYAWNYNNWGGAQVHMLSLMKRAQCEFDVHLVVPNGTDPHFLSFMTGLDVTVHHFDPPVTGRPVVSVRDRIRRRIEKIRSETAMLRAINELADENTIVHVDLSPQQAFRTLIRLSKRYRVFTTIHNSASKHSVMREFLWRNYCRRLFRFPNFNLFAGNNDTKTYIGKYLSDRDFDRIKVTSTAVDPDEIERTMRLNIDRDQMRRRVGIPFDKILVLTVGQFIDRKGRWTLLEAARKVISEHDNVVFVWVTPELPKGEELARVQSYGLGNSFSVIASSDIGSDRISILSFVKSSDIFVLPSLVEGLPIAVLEAMALEVPAISTRINAIPEAIKENCTGLLVEPGDSGQLAERILELLRNQERRRYLGKNGRIFVLENFDASKVAETALNAYISSLAQPIQEDAC